MKTEMIKVLYFGIAQEITGAATEEFKAAGSEDLRRQMLEKHPRLKSIVFRLALNGRMIISDCPLNNSDTVALLPPFAGG